MNFVNALYRRRKFILLTTLIVAVVSMAFSLIMPQHFRATTTIFPPLEDEGISNLANLISDLPMKALGLGGSSIGTETFMAILKSRTLMESLALKFDLQARYKKKDMEKTLKELRRHVGVNLDDEGTLTLFVEASTPWIAGGASKDEARDLSMKMANYCIDKLDQLNKSFRAERGKNSRIFIENRYQQNLVDMETAENALKSFQETHGILYLPEQIRATIDVAAKLQAQLIAKELEASVIKETMGSRHSTYTLAANEIRMLKEALQGLRENNDSKRVDDQGLFLELEGLPELSVQYARLYREVLLQEKLLEFILPQYEQAKIQEAKDTPSLQILDKAVKPIKKHRPKRAMVVFFFTFLALLTSCAWIAIKPTFSMFLDELKSN